MSSTNSNAGYSEGLALMGFLVIALPLTIRFLLSMAIAEHLANSKHNQIQNQKASARIKDDAVGGVYLILIIIAVLVIGVVVAGFIAIITKGL